MARAGVVLDVEKRKAAIRSQAERLAAKAGGRVLWDEDLLSEVADLVEAPAAVLGTYPRQALAIPQPVVVAAMQEHQRYFPVGDDAGKLLPFFIAVSNGIATKAVVAGNERVLKARLADARYFYEVDRKKRLEDFLPALDGVVWQAGAGSMRHKASRLESLAGWLAGRVGIAGADAHHVRRAALLCKADLVTQMVGEFPGLQGVTGGLYAMSHEPAEVAEAVAGHYRPAGPKDDVPSTDEGCAVALADKADSIAGHLALGHIPSGTADPYGLRRAGIGIIRIISEKDWRLSLSALAESAAGGYAGGPLAIPDVRAVAALAVQFLRGRMEAIFEEQGFAHDEIQASLVSFDDVVQAGRRLKALATLRHRPQFRDVIFALSRVTNIVPAGFAGTGVAPASLGDEERALYDAHEAVRESALALAGECKFEELYGLLSALKPPIDRFFEKVLVMEKDDTVRNRRLSLLKRVEESIRLFADVRRLVIA
jgi:glycyl-tRNA synthetase beta chain